MQSIIVHELITGRHDRPGCFVNQITNDLNKYLSEPYEEARFYCGVTYLHGDIKDKKLEILLHGAIRGYVYFDDDNIVTDVTLTEETRKIGCYRVGAFLSAYRHVGSKLIFV